MPSYRLSRFKSAQDAQDTLLDRYGIFLSSQEINKMWDAREQGIDFHFRVTRHTKRKRWTLKITKRDMPTEVLVYLSPNVGIPLSVQMKRAHSYAKGRNMRIVDYSAERSFLDNWLKNPHTTRIMLIYEPSIILDFKATKDRLAENDNWLIVFRKKDRENA